MKPSGNLLQFGEDAEGQDARDRGRRCRSASACISSPTSPASSRRRSAASPRRWSRPCVDRAASSASSASACAPGFVVSFSIPLVLALVFVAMDYLRHLAAAHLARRADHRARAAGRRRHDHGRDDGQPARARRRPEKAATFAYTSTAFPMLTGTLVTVAGFIPIGFNASSAGEYTYIAVRRDRGRAAAELDRGGAVRAADRRQAAAQDDEAQRRRARPRHAASSRRVLLGAMRWRWVTIASASALLALSVVGMGYVQQQFFPSSDRPELLVDMTLPQNASIARDQGPDGPLRAAASRAIPTSTQLELLCGPGRDPLLPAARPAARQPLLRPDGRSSPRSLEARERVQARLRKLAREEFVGIDVFVHPLDLGPPVGRPVQYRRQRSRRADGARAGAASSPSSSSNNPISTRRPSTGTSPARWCGSTSLQDKARQLGISSSDVASVLNGIVGGTTITQVRDSIYLVDVVGRAEGDERNRDRDPAEPADPDQQRHGRAARSRSPPCATSSNSRSSGGATACRPSPCAAAVHDATQPATVVQQLAPAIQTFTAKLPAEFTSRSAARSRRAARARGRSRPSCP